MNKELKRDKLYICDIEYDYELESGRKGIAKEKLIGYVNGKENNHYYGGDTMSLT